MAPIATLIFLDFESITLDKKKNLTETKITELSLVALKRTHILSTDTEIKGELPRVKHKLTLCINPGLDPKTVIDNPFAIKSGPDIRLLQQEPVFSLEVYDTIKSFIECLEKPVCLVAHNGFDFDFPILMNHLKWLNVSLDKDVMCSDSIYAFYDIFSGIPVSNVFEESSADLDELEDKDKDKQDSNMNTLSAHMSNLTVESNKTDTLTDDDQCPSSLEAKNENTPKSNTLEMRPANPAMKLDDLTRPIFYGMYKKKPIVSYTLPAIYERVFGRQAYDTKKGKEAEKDCIMVAEIAMSEADKFVKWIDANHCAFFEVSEPQLPKD